MNKLFLYLLDEDNYKGTILSVIFIIIIVALFCLPLFHNINNISPDEAWLQFLSYHAFLRQGVVEFSQIPLWSPNFGGGYPFVEHPENPFLSPLILITIFFGEVLGLKLIILYCYIAASLGMFYLTRYVLKFNLAGSMFSSLIFVLNNNLPYHISTGNICETNFYYLPLIFAFFLKAKEKAKYLVICIIIFSALIANGAGLCIVVMLLFFVLFSVVNSFRWLDKKVKFNGKYLRNLCIMIIASILLMSARILPSLKLLSINDRGFDNYSDAAEGSLTSENFYYSLFPNAPYIGEKGCFPDGTSGVDSTMYFGYIPLILCLLAFLIYKRELFRYLILLAIFIILCFGNNSPLDLFRILWKVPLFHSLHYPNKYFAFFCAFIISLAAGRIFLVFKKQKMNKLVITSFVLLVIFISIGHLFMINRVYHEVVFTEKKPEFKPEAAFYHIKSITADPGKKSEYRFHRDGEKNALLQYVCVNEHKGLINWHGNINLGEYPQPKYFVDLKTEKQASNPDYKGEEYFLKDNVSNKVKTAYFSPNEFRFDVIIKNPDKLIVNQNYHKDWKSSEGKAASYNGLLSIDLAKEGRYIVKLKYTPVSFYIGLIVSALTLIALILAGKKLK